MHNWDSLLPIAPDWDGMHCSLPGERWLYPSIPADDLDVSLPRPVRRKDGHGHLYSQLRVVAGLSSQQLLCIRYQWRLHWERLAGTMQPIALPAGGVVLTRQARVDQRALCVKRCYNQ